MTRAPADPEVVAEAPADPVAAAQACLGEGRVAEAQALLEQLLARQPDHGLARSALGLVRYVMGDHAAAERELSHALALEPLHFDTHCTRAFALAGLGRNADAIRAFRRALALDPACGFARLQLAEILIGEGRKTEAIQCLIDGRGRGPRDEEIDALLARAAEDDGAPRLLDGPRAHEAQVLAPEWADPRTLLHPGRMDVAVKALYARALLGGPAAHSGYPAEDVYLRHIQFRTGGAEPGDEGRKGSLASFTLEFARLVESMKAHGFDPACPIPVARRTGLILNGAHRLAAALAIGLERVPVIREDGVDGLTWDFDWFVRHAFRPGELDEIARAWIELRGDRAGTVLLWPAAIAHWDAIEREIGSSVPIACRRELSLPPHAFAELVRDVYASDWGPRPGENIERKVEFFAAYPPRARLLVVATSGDPDELARVKRETRERWAHVVPADRFATLHTTEKPSETTHVAGLLLSEESLAGLRARPAGGLRPEFVSWLADYHAALRRLAIDPEHACVVGSAVLEALGVRDATDLDFTVTHAVRRRRFTPGVTHVTGDLDVVARDYPRVIARGSAPTDDDLIRDRALHFRVRGLKFATLDVVVERKLLQARPKDLEDAARVGRMRLDGGL